MTYVLPPVRLRYSTRVGAECRRGRGLRNRPGLDQQREAGRGDPGCDHRRQNRPRPWASHGRRIGRARRQHRGIAACRTRRQRGPGTWSASRRSIAAAYGSVPAIWEPRCMSRPASRTLAQRPHRPLRPLAHRRRRCRTSCLARRSGCRRADSTDLDFGIDAERDGGGHDLPAIAASAATSVQARPRTRC